MKDTKFCMVRTKNVKNYYLCSKFFGKRLVSEKYKLILSGLFCEKRKRFFSVENEIVTNY